nr:ATP-binding protein [Gemmatimonadales bacterium]
MTVTLNPLYRFETFVVGSANRLAVTAAKAVAESPGTVYNPLFIYARPGLGKTHLLMGLGHAARAINPRLAVEYLTLDEFVEAFHAAIAAGQGEVYRKRFLDVDLLLVDDVQFLTHRREMQAELLRLTDALQTANRQIVLTSDRPPAEIEALDERLIRRFAGGLIIDVSAPDYETRVAILRRKAEERRATFAEGVLEAIAGLGIDNVRELLGALNRLIAFQAVEGPVSADRARGLIGGGSAGQ